MRRWALGLISLLLKITSHLPSTTLRKVILKYIFRMQIEKRCAIASNTEFKIPWQIKVGSCSAIASGCILDGRRGINIGKNVTIAFNVMIWTLQHDYQSITFEAVGEPVTIGDYAWLGSGSIVLPGITIGKGAVIAAGAVVTKDVEEFSVVAGNPAKKIASRPKNLNYCSGDWELPFV